MRVQQHLEPVQGSRDIAPPPDSALLHGAVLRPPSLLWNGCRYTGPTLTEIDMEAARQVPGVVDVIVLNNFIGVVASQPRQALHARAQIRSEWRQAPEPSRLQISAKSDTPGTPPAAAPLEAPDAGDPYAWPEPSAPSSWAIAHFDGQTLTVWTANPHSPGLKDELGLICNLPLASIALLPNGQRPVDGHDVAVDAALLSLGVRQAVRVQQDGTPPEAPAQWRFLPKDDSQPAPEGIRQSRAVSNRYLHDRPSIAALLCGFEQDNRPTTLEVRTDYTPQADSHSVAPQDVPVSGRAGNAAGQIFAGESYIDELARLRGEDPVEARLRQLDDPRGRSLIRSVAQQARWSDTRTPGTGKGFAYTHVIDNSQEPPRKVWAAWVAEVAVDGESGHIDLTRITVGHDAEEVEQQAHTSLKLEDRLQQAAAGLLQHQPQFDDWDTEAAPASRAVSLPKVDLVAQDHALNPAVSWSRHAELPAAAAIANAIYDATGVRFRQPPFNGSIEQVRRKAPARKLSYALLGGIAATAAGLLVAALPWRSAIAPATVDTSLYSNAAIERGRLVAAAGDCIVCHTAPGGIDNAGGRPLETPFGTVYTTNITPDRETGIGAWSYAAFERAMREGIHRDGRRLYPAFPYTAFAKMSDADMQALYAYLMTREPVSSSPPPTRLDFPYNLRPMLAGWNLLFHRNERYTPDPERSTLWNRGAYLVQGAGHCAACHSPRNALGAEKSDGLNFLGGGFADGWEAPALNSLSKAPIPWTEDSLYDYLRTGYSSLHGVAAGPMAPVVRSMAELPDSDVRAVAHYLASLSSPEAQTAPLAVQAAILEDAGRNNPAAMTHPGDTLFEGACAVCHDARGGPPLFGARPSLALNSNLHSAVPDNVIQVLLHGVNDPAADNLGTMAGFKDSMNDQQLETLVAYLRLRFAPDKPAWTDIGEKIRALRNAGHD